MNKNETDVPTKGAAPDLDLQPLFEQLPKPSTPPPSTLKTSFFKRFAAKPKSTPGQIALGMFYLLLLVVSLGLSLYYARTDFKLATGWLVAGIVLSQVFIDLAQFSSPQKKGLFSAAFRILAGLVALVLIYFS